MYALKSLARRGTALGMAAAVLAAATLPAAPAFADALNPLTDRSLTLSSSAPGYVDKDGSGNTTYAPPNSGANGKQTGNTFSFKVSTNSTNTGTNAPVKAMSFQYCTTPAGNCLAPGNNGFTGDAGDDGAAIPNSTTTIAAKKSNLDVTATTPSQIPQANLGSYVNTTSGLVTAIPARTATGTNFVVMYKSAGTWVSSDGWAMTVHNKETGEPVDHAGTGMNNEIRLTNATGQGFTTGQEVKVIFFATDTNYITNPGEGAFFVRINHYKEHLEANLTDANVIDGGVTVANVMNLSIQIQTKVLETMDFSVGTVDPDTLSNAQLNTARGLSGQLHSICDPILGSMNPADPQNTLLLGAEDTEYSLATDSTYSTHSYFRLSSNASAGATVYYSGVTLSNTVGDKIAPMDTTHNTGGLVDSAPIRGKEQFGLALANGTAAPYNVDYSTERQADLEFESGADNLAAGLAALNTPAPGDSTGYGVHSSVATDTTGSVWKRAQLQVNADTTSLAPLAGYGGGSGWINPEYDNNAVVPDTQARFAFSEGSSTIPVPIASEDSRVVDCATGKVRYMANIAATTPAGIYTTSINFIAAPQY